MYVCVNVCVYVCVCICMCMYVCVCAPVRWKDYTLRGWLLLFCFVLDTYLPTYLLDHHLSLLAVFDGIVRMYSQLPPKKSPRNDPGKVREPYYL